SQKAALLISLIREKWVSLNCSWQNTHNSAIHHRQLYLVNCCSPLGKEWCRSKIHTLKHRHTCTAHSNTQTHRHTHTHRHRHTPSHIHTLTHTHACTAHSNPQTH